MSDIRFEIAARQNEIQQKIDEFLTFVSKVSSDSLFQFRCPNLMGECYTLLDFIDNGDISETLLDKIDDITQRINRQLDDPDFKRLKEAFSH